MSLSCSALAPPGRLPHLASCYMAWSRDLDPGASSPHQRRADLIDRPHQVAQRVARVVIHIDRLPFDRLPIHAPGPGVDIQLLLQTERVMFGRQPPIARFFSRFCIAWMPTEIVFFAGRVAMRCAASVAAAAGIMRGTLGSRWLGLTLVL